MSNRIDTAMSAIETALKTLVETNGTGVLKAVERRLINPHLEQNVPVLGLVPLRADRVGGAGGTWTVTVQLALCTRGKRDEGGADASEIMAAVQGAINTLAATSKTGWQVDLPGWTFWFANLGDYLVPCGARGTLRITISGDLLIPPD